MDQTSKEISIIEQKYGLLANHSILSGTLILTKNKETLNNYEIEYMNNIKNFK
jgi:hypothetical protein